MQSFCFPNIITLCLISYCCLFNPIEVFCQNDDDDEVIIGLPTDWSDDVYDYQTLPKIVKQKISCMASIQVTISTYKVTIIVMQPNLRFTQTIKNSKT